MSASIDKNKQTMILNLLLNKQYFREFHRLLRCTPCVECQEPFNALWLWYKLHTPAQLNIYNQYPSRGYRHLQASTQCSKERPGLEASWCYSSAHPIALHSPLNVDGSALWIARVHGHTAARLQSDENLAVWMWMISTEWRKCSIHWVPVQDKGSKILCVKLGARKSLQVTLSIRNIWP